MLTIYAVERLDRDLFGWQMPVVVGAVDQPDLHHHAVRRVRRALDAARGAPAVDAGEVRGSATIVVGLAFLLFLPFRGTGPHGTPVLAIVLILLVFTVAELLLSPVGLSRVATKLAPERFRTQMVALFFLSVALGSAASGLLAGVYDPSDEVPYFSVLGLVSVAVGVALLLLARPVLRLMRGVR